MSKMKKSEADDVKLVPFPEDLWSEDSSFYGDDETKAELEAEVAAFNPREFWDIYAWNYRNLIAWDNAQSNDSRGIKRQLDESTERPAKRAKMPKNEENNIIPNDQSGSKSSRRRIDAHNPYADQPEAYQLHETISEFLTRRPPSTTDTSSGAWLWVADPHSTAHESKGDYGTFTQSGHALLEEYLSRKQKMEEANPGKGAGIITRKLKPDRDWLENSILNLAKEKRVVVGKWMLFVMPNQVDAVWEKVVQGTIEGKLGCSAKVATNDGNTDKPERLICVYTEDFNDVDDVKRVLRGLHNLELVGDPADGDSRSIYYKCDAFTLLDIMSGNEYKLRASMYSSKDMFKEMAGK